MTVIFPVRTADDLRVVTDLFRAYAASLEIELDYQDFDTELTTLPGKYAPPEGELLLARDKLGCVALRPLTATCCEMKRLYVTPEGRGLGIGRALVDAVIQKAIDIGYQEIRLDTLSTMTRAISLYQKAGFCPMPAYYDTPIEDTLFFSRHLAA